MSKAFLLSVTVATNCKRPPSRADAPFTNPAEYGVAYNHMPQGQLAVMVRELKPDVQADTCKIHSQSMVSSAFTPCCPGKILVWLA